MTDDLPFIDLQAQRRRLGPDLDDAIAAVLAHGAFIMGPEVVRLEDELAAFTGAAHALTCGSGTDALLLPLMAWGIGPGDAVLVPTFTFAATAEVVALTGATPVFVDVDALSFNLSLDHLAATVAEVAAGPLRLAAVIPVDLFGQPADVVGVGKVLADAGVDVPVLADGAQSFGAARDGARVGTMGTATATSFFPAKPLGCYGDGGAVFTDDADLHDVLVSLRVHGQGTDRYDNVRVGLNARLDTIQAAILLVKLAAFPAELVARQAVADRYADGLAGLPGVRTPVLDPGATSAWAQYTLRLGDHDRAEVARRLGAAGIPTAIYYPKPLHAQTAYRQHPSGPGGCPVAMALADEVLSLPMHPDLDEVVQDRIIAGVRGALA